MFLSNPHEMLLPSLREIQLKSPNWLFGQRKFLGYFQPQEGKPALWELDLDYYLLVSGIGDDLIPENCCELNAKPAGSVGMTFRSIPACREDLCSLKLTSFDKLIEKTCSTIKNVRLCSEPDQRPDGVSGSSGVAPDAA